MKEDKRDSGKGQDGEGRKVVVTTNQPGQPLSLFGIQPLAGVDIRPLVAQLLADIKSLPTEQEQVADLAWFIRLLADAELRTINQKVIDRMEELQNLFAGSEHKVMDHLSGYKEIHDLIAQRIKDWRTVKTLYKEGTRLT